MMFSVENFFCSSPKFLKSTFGKNLKLFCNYFTLLTYDVSPLLYNSPALLGVQLKMNMKDLTAKLKSLTNWPPFHGIFVAAV